MKLSKPLIQKPNSPATRQLLSASLLTLLVMQGAQAAVDIKQEPLTVQEPLEPNILFIMDDSGSMLREYMPDSIPDTSPDSQSEYNFYRNSQENLVYYNPATVYEAPPKEDGTSWGNASFPYAKSNGFCTSSCSTTDLLNSGYYDNVFYYYDSGSYSWHSSSQTYATDADGDNISVFVYTTKEGNTYTENYIADDCTGDDDDNELINCDDSAEAKQNLANWFSYYRSREKLAKSSSMIAFENLNEDYRLGYAELNGYQKMSNPALSVNKVKVFGDGSDGTRKKEFYDWLKGNSSSGGTPLQLRLDNAGKYFQTDHPWLSDPSDSSSEKYACRQSFTIMTSDGFWNSTEISIASADRDDTDGSEITGPNNNTYTYTAAAPYSADFGSNENLADIAMKYWKNDLHSISNEVPTSNEDPAFWQHMVTFTIGLGLTPTVKINGSNAELDVDALFDWANGGSPIAGFAWPTPYANNVSTVSDMAHAAVNGHGGFYSAKNPEEFTNALSDALARASERVGSAASLAANSTKLDVGTFTYQANYFTGQWKGDLKSYAVDANTGVIATNYTWSADNNLPAYTSRVVKTYNPTTGTMVAFGDPANLNSAQQARLGSSTTEQQNFINWLKGDTSNEESNGGTLRNRTAKMGDIVNSQPVYVGQPYANLYANKTFTGQTTYVDFATDDTTSDGDAVSLAATRSPVVYVAGNDGFLHGFDAGTGVETFAYLPAAVILQNDSSASDPATTRLTSLANPNYGTVNAIIQVPHRFYNDGEMTIADVYFTALSSWRTVLVGTTGRGIARSVYALDVTDPTNVQFLWERYADDGLTNSNYIGQMAGKPVIAQTGNGVWTVLMGNCYNSAANKAALLQFNLSDGALTVHTTDNATDNGLAAPVIMDTNNDGFQDSAAAGDLNGKVWHFTSLTTATPGTHKFTATDSSSNAQPITAGMLAGIDPDNGDIWLFFGTGQYLNSNDLIDLSTQSWYGIIIGTTAASPASPTLKLLSNGRAALKHREILAEIESTDSTLAARGFTLDDGTNDMIDDNDTTGDITDDTRYAGWYIDLTSPTNGAEGERITNTNQFQGKALIATTRIPEAVDPCNTSGRGWIMAINPFTGTNVTTSFFDYNNDDILSNDVITVDGVTYPVGAVGFDALPNAPIFIGNRMLINFDDGTSTSIETSGGAGTASRESWRELY
jgi:type IV pilus assembly protein PilY1